MKSSNHKITSPQSLNSYIKSICDIMRRSGRAGALQYVPGLTWILFLRILDEKEEREIEHAKALGVEFTPSLDYPYRWSDWASPDGKKRKELQDGTLGAFMSFANSDLIPYLKNLENKPGATSRQKMISEIFSSIEKTGIDTERISLTSLTKSMNFLLNMLMKRKDWRTIYVPCCRTGGFLAQAYTYMKEKSSTADDIETLKTRTFYGRKKENLVYPIAIANLVLHEIDESHIWHGNTLTGLEVYGGLFQGTTELFDVVLTNPPFGGKEGKDAQTRFAYKTSSTQVLFLQHVIDSLKPGRRCGIVMDEGVLFRANETAFVQTKRKLLNECNLFCIISLPPKVFVNAGAASKTNLLLFVKGEPTKEITKKQPLTVQHFDDFFKLFNPSTLKLSESQRSWRMPIENIEAKNYDIKAVNPNRKDNGDKRTPEELFNIIESQTKEIQNVLTRLRDTI